MSSKRKAGNATDNAAGASTSSKKKAGNATDNAARSEHRKHEG